MHPTRPRDTASHTLPTIPADAAYGVTDAAAVCDCSRDVIKDDLKRGAYAHATQNPVGRREWSIPVVDLVAGGRLDPARVADRVAAPDGVISAYASRRDRLDLPFRTMLFGTFTIHRLGSNDFPEGAKSESANELTDTAADDAVTIPIADPLPLERIADAHDCADAASHERIPLTILR